MGQLSKVAKNSNTSLDGIITSKTQSNFIRDLLVDSKIEENHFSPLRIMLCEQSRFAGKRVSTDRLLFVVKAPVRGWTLPSLEFALMRFYEQSHEPIQLERLQISIGSRWIGQPKLVKN